MKQRSPIALFGGVLRARPITVYEIVFTDAVVAFSICVHVGTSVL